jgi:CRISPR-associated protein Csx10
MSTIRLKIEALQPILATSFAGDPNSDVSYPYLPGSLLRGALIGRYLRQSNQRELDLSNSLVQNLFFDAKQSSYLNAYPVSRLGQRTLPTLRSWFKEKGDKIPEKGDNISLTAYDFSLEVDEELESPKPLDKGFWSYDTNNEINLYQPNKRINIHNARDRNKGRGTEKEGEIFRYESIDAGELFEGIIICQEDYIEKFKELLQNQDFWMGGSQSAGYGHVHIKYEVLDEPWCEADKKKDSNSDELQITLLSDVILRDSMGQVTASPDLLKQAISHKVGCELSFHSERHSYLEHTTVGGFNRKWGLPLPQVPALAMGSVLVLTGELSPEQIEQLESEGIGERRIDGFGRLAINAWQQENFSICFPDELHQNPLELTLPEDSLDMVKVLADRVLHQRLEGLLQKRASELSIKGGRISNSQLSRLRLVARESINNGNFDMLANLLNNLPKNAAEQFDSAKVEGKTLMSWLMSNIKEPGKWIVNPDKSTLEIADQKYSFTEVMKIEYTLRLIMALAKKAAKSEVPV